VTGPSRAELGLLAPSEVAFMVARHQARARGSFHGSDRCWGVSSDALADYSLGLRGAPTRRDYPFDPSDLAACERTFRMAPEHLQQVMRPVLDLYRAAVEERCPGAIGRVTRFIETGVGQ
jgi:hypothetical protein